MQLCYENFEKKSQKSIFVENLKPNVYEIFEDFFALHRNFCLLR